MANNMYRNTYAEIDLNALKHNLNAIQINLGKDKKIIPVLKANAYGHGSVEVAQVLEAENYDLLAVALLEEAMELRDAGIKATILVLGWVAPKFAYIATQHNFILTVFQTKWLEEIQNEDLKKELQIHIKLDTGMGRNGLRNELELMSFIHKLKDVPAIKVKGIYTHFASADHKDHTYFKEQLMKFDQLVNMINKIYSTKDLIIHVGNSAASIQHAKDMPDYSRVGVSLYGMYPSSDVKSTHLIDLKPVLALKSEITHVKQTKAGDKIGYASSYTAEEGDWIGTVAIGYADGWLRKLQNTDVLVAGKRMKIVGRICMDMLMIKLDKAYEIGTEVTLIGNSGDESISIDEIADHLETINYEITTNITSRVPRLYDN